MEQRKADIRHRLDRLKTEVLCTQTLLGQLLDSSIAIDATVQNEKDQNTFRRLYPTKIADLDSRLHHVVNFNCLIESLIDHPKVTTNEPNSAPLADAKEHIPHSTVNSIAECSSDVQVHPVKVNPQLVKPLKDLSSDDAPTIFQESDRKCNSPVPTPDLSWPAIGDSSYKSNKKVHTQSGSVETWIQNYSPPPIVLHTSSEDARKEIVLPTPIVASSEDTLGEVKLPSASANLTSNVKETASEYTLKETILAPPIADLPSNDNTSYGTETFPGDSLKESILPTKIVDIPATAVQEIGSENKCVSRESSQNFSTDESVGLQEPKQVFCGVLENQALSVGKILANKQGPIKVPITRMQNRNQNVNTPKQALSGSPTPFRSQIYNKNPIWKQNDPAGQHCPISNHLPGQCNTKYFQNIAAIPKNTPNNAPSIAKVPYVPNLVPMFPDTLLSLLPGKNEWFGLVAHAISPSEFYFHVSTADNDKIDDFHVAINDFYQSSARVTLERKWEVQENVGNFCACYFEGDTSSAVSRGWYRAQVLDWLPDTKYTVLMQLVDFGNKFMAKLADIQPLSKRFVDRPVFATRCHLSYLRPPEPCKEWPQSTNDIFLKRLGLENLEISFMISPIGKADIPPFSTKYNPKHLNHSKSVPVILVPDDNLGTVNDYLIDIAFAEFDSQMEIHQVEAMESNERVKEFEESRRKVEDWCLEDKVAVKPERPARVPSPEFRLSMYGKPEPKTNPTQPEDKMDSWDPMQEDFENADFNDEDACVAVTGYAPTDESRVCRFFAADGHCPWGNKCRREHVLSNIHGITTDTEEVYGSAYNDLPMHSMGECISIQVTSAQGGYFYAIERLKNSTSALDMLCDAINTRANIAAYKRLKIVPALGQIVLAKFSKDGRFYRARVIDGGDGSVSVFVFFVDFGNWELVPEKDLREIEPKFMHLAFQAMRCSLANVILTDKMHEEAAKFFCSEFGPPKVLMASVITGDASTLNVLATDEHNNDVGEVMINNGFGTFFDVSNILHFKFKKGDMIPG